jgi:hypothetical protein
MKANFYKSSKPEHLILKVEDANQDISEPLVILLHMLPSVSSESISIINENIVEFMFVGLTPEVQKELKISIINSVRELFNLNSSQLAAAFLLAKQQQESLVIAYNLARQAGEGAIIRLQVLEEYVRKMHAIVGWASITTILAITIAIVALIVRS